MSRNRSARSSNVVAFPKWRCKPSLLEYQCPRCRALVDDPTHQRFEICSFCLLRLRMEIDARRVRYSSRPFSGDAYGTRA